MAAADRLLTRAEAAGLLRVSERTIDRLATSGELPRQRVGGRAVRYLESDVLALIRATDDPTRKD